MKKNSTHYLHLIREKGVSPILPLVINLTDKNGRTPLHIASRKNAKVVELLLEKKAIVEPLDKWGLTPLHYAALAGMTAVMGSLVRNGASVNKNKSTLSPLFYLASHSKKKDSPSLKRKQGLAVQLLIKSNAEIDWRPITQMSAHYLFAGSGNTIALVLLLFAGAQSLEVCAKPEFPKISAIVDLAETICSLRTWGSIFNRTEIVATIIDYASPSVETVLNC